jgi:hypothetical protein
VALIGFGVDSCIEVISPRAAVATAQGRPRRHRQEESGAERRALYIVAATFFLLAAYISYEAGTALLGREAPDRSAVGLHELFGWWWADPVGALAMLPVIL